MKKIENIKISILSVLIFVTFIFSQIPAIKFKGILTIILLVMSIYLGITYEKSKKREFGEKAGKPALIQKFPEEFEGVK